MSYYFNAKPITTEIQEEITWVMERYIGMPNTAQTQELIQSELNCLADEIRHDILVYGKWHSKRKKWIDGWAIWKRINGN